MAGLKPLFASKQIQNAIDDFIQQQEDATLKKLQYLGEQFVNDARSNGNYQDRTGNLRSSIGYVILKDGSVIEQNFQKSSKGTDKATGMRKGVSFANEVGLDFTEGWVLIGVAGMNYAAYVEAKNYDVITGSVPDEEIIKKFFSENDI